MKELKNLEEDVPRLQETDFAKAARNYEANTGVRCDGFHPHVPLNFTRETKGEAVEFSKKVAQCGRWPQQACTTMFFLIPKNVPNERPIALVLTMIRWWEALRAPEVAEWQQQYRIGWDATDGPNGAAERTVWGTLQEMERFNDHAGERDQAAVALVSDLAKAFDQVSLPVVWAWATHFKISMKTLRVLRGHFRAPAERSVRRMCGGSAPDHHCHSPWIQVELLALTYCVAGRTE